MYFLTDENFPASRKLSDGLKFGRSSSCPLWHDSTESIGC